MAGKRLGKEDDRHLWPEMLRAIREIQPRYVVGENVSGLVNWNGGMVFDEVQAEMEAEGYQVTPFLLPACAVNAPHRRDRIWFVAYRSAGITGQKIGGRFEKKTLIGNTGHGSIGTTSDTDSNGYELLGLGEDRSTESKSFSEGDQRKLVWDDNRGTCQQELIADTNNIRQQGGSNSRIIRSEGKIRNQRFENMGRFSGTDWQNFPTQSPVCDGNDGISSRLDGITFPKWRNESIKAGGNAIVPQVAYQIFQAIEQYETLTPILQ